MTAPPDGHPPATEAEMDAGNAAKPDRGQADDGKTGGVSTGGTPGPATGGDGAGINVQSGTRSGAETERNAPGMSTDKKADDTK